MSDFLARIARTLSHRWGRGLLAALALLFVLGGLASSGQPADGDFAVPGSESQKAIDLLQKHTPALAGVDSQIVFTAKDGTKITDPANQAVVDATIAKVLKLKGVAGAASPYDSPKTAISPDGTIAQTTVQYNLSSGKVKKEDGTALIDAVDTANTGGVTAAARGAVVQQGEQQSFPVGELVGLVLAVILLLLLFRSFSAMLATLIGAIVGVMVGQMLLTILAQPLGLPAFASSIAFLLGFGAGLDYALLIIARFREQLAEGDSVRDAAGKAAATSGSAVVTAGLIVMVAIAGLLVIGIPLIGKMGIGAALAVFAVVISALTVTPMMMGALSRWLKPKKYSVVAPSKAFARWGEFVTRRPWVSITVGVLIMLVFAAPMLSMRLGQPDDGNSPKDNVQRIAYDQLSKGFGPGSNGPLLLAIDTTANSTPAELESLRAAIAKEPGVVAATPAVPSKDGEMATMIVVPKTSPQDPATSQLIKDLRNNIIPASTKGTDLQVYIGGATAGFDDFASKTAAGLPVFIAVVIGLSVLLLIAAFRSLWIPLVSALFNLLSVAAAYGVVVAVFQKGIGADLIGVGSDVPIVSFIPVMMFAILFGLSMDYNVFLLSRIHERYKEGDGPRDSVINGLSRIGKVILVAGLVMASVFTAFVTDPDVISKMFGLGLGVAILVDVLFVRLVIAPAVVFLLGDKAWWLPKWMDKLIPNISLEGHLVAGLDPKGPTLGPDGWSTPPVAGPADAPAPPVGAVVAAPAE